MKPTTVNRKAKELLDNGKIAARIEGLQAAARERHEVTVDSLTADLEDDRKLAHKANQAGAAVSATLGKAKLHGLLKGRHEHSGPDDIPIRFTLNLADDGDDDGAT